MICLAQNVILKIGLRILVAKKDLFIVTDFTELNLQPFLKEKLKTYPVFAEGDGYIIYNLMEDSGLIDEENLF